MLRASCPRLSVRLERRDLRHLCTSPITLAKASTHLLALPRLDKETDHVEARAWAEGFGVDDVPKEAYQVGRSRSSGPGGQHVNKTESKITIRCDLSQAKGKWLPPFVFPPLTKSPHYLASPPSLQIASQQSRVASQNLNTALTSLVTTIRSAATSVIVNPTAPEQRARVKGLAKKENERRLEGKKRKSDKKASRRDI